MLPLIQSLRLCSLPRFRLLSSPFQTGRREAVIGIRRNARRLCSTAEVSDYELDELHEDGRVVERENALHQALTQLAPDFGRESMLSLQRFFSSRRAPVISTGSLKLDLALGIGGLPKGRMVEIYGQEASGKTTLALHIIKEAQKLGGYCAYLDVENAMDPSLPESMGIDTENLLISPPDSAENLLNVVDTLTKSGSVDVIVVDSVAVCGWAIFAAIKVSAFNMAIKVAALVPQQEIDTVIGGQKEDRQARIMTQALRKIHHSLCQSQTVIIFLNQVRSDLKSVKGFGRVDEVTCGGNALKFYSAVRLRMNRTRLLKTENKPTGLGVCVQVIKNKLGPASKKAELGIRFGRGFCVESEVLELACEHGIIMVEGGNYLIEGETFSNRNEAEQFLSENDEALDNIVSSLRRQLFESGNFMRPLNR